MALLKSIMLIEDDIDDQEFFIEALQGIDNASLYAVAGNGKEALDRLKNTDNLPDFIFSDIQMPVMDGVECLTAMKNNFRTRNIPYIILSSSVAHSEIACSLGAIAFVKKPDNFNRLRDKIKEMIDLGGGVGGFGPRSNLKQVSAVA